MNTLAQESQTSSVTQSNSLVLDVQDLSVTFSQGDEEKEVVRHVSFNIKSGETVALVGESGSGKSVTALSIMQLLPYPMASHPNGSIRFKGEELIGADQATLRKIRGDRIGMIFGSGWLKPISRPAQCLSTSAFGRAATTRHDSHGAGQ